MGNRASQPEPEPVAFRSPSVHHPFNSPDVALPFASQYNGIRSKPGSIAESYKFGEYKKNLNHAQRPGALPPMAINPNSLQSDYAPSAESWNFKPQAKRTEYSDNNDNNDNNDNIVSMPGAWTFGGRKKSQSRGRNSRYHRKKSNRKGSSRSRSRSRGRSRSRNSRNKTRR